MPQLLSIISMPAVIANASHLTVLLITYSLVVNHILAQRLSKCDFHKYQKGCRNARTQVCDAVSHLCRCRPEFPIGLSHGICLERKSMDEGCMGSVQCSHVANAGCYGLDTEFKDDFWIQLWYKFGLNDPGKCGCDARQAYSYNRSANACVKELVIGRQCASGWDCYSKVPNSICNAVDRCECAAGHTHDRIADSCKKQLNYGDTCAASDDCAHAMLQCNDGVCQCARGHYYDKYKTPKCQPNKDGDCPDNYKWNPKMGACIDKRLDMAGNVYSNNIRDYELIEPPRFYSIFVILALWICLLFILGNAKRGIRLVEQAVRRDQASQYRQCDIQTPAQPHNQPTIYSQPLPQSSVSSSLNQYLPPPSFDELYPSASERFDDEPPRYEDVVKLDNDKDMVV